MKLILLTAVISFLCAAALGQKAASERVNIGIIDPDSFYDPNLGIKVLLSAIAPLESEFKSSNDEILPHVEKYKKLASEISQTSDQVKPGTNVRMTSAERLMSFERKRVLSNQSRRTETSSTGSAEMNCQNRSFQKSARLLNNSESKKAWK